MEPPSEHVNTKCWLLECFHTMNSRYRIPIVCFLLAALFPVTVVSGQSSEDSGGSMKADVSRMATAGSNTGRREVLEAILGDAGIGFETETFTIEEREDYPRTEGRNLIVTLGSGPSDIVIGAHYDAIRFPDATLSLAAVDNAAGSIVLTRLAETLAAESFEHRIVLVFFDMEELGLVGSGRYLAAHSTDTIDAMINLDVVGYGDTLMMGPAAGPGNAAIYGALAQACVDEGIECLNYPQYPPSDDRTFQAAGIANVSIGTLPAPEAHRLWLLLNSDPQGVFDPGFMPRILGLIHTPADTPEAVEAQAMDIAYRAVLNLVRQLDRSDD